MVKRQQINREMVDYVAGHLGPLLGKVVFLGGATTSLLITDPASPDIRGTLDVDVIVEIVSLAAYHRFGKSLTELGFRPDDEEGAPICRWRIGKIKVDVMPTEAGIIGFSNRWYPLAMETARTVRLNDTTDIRLVDPACFLGTKLEAFRNRGHADYSGSHDLEDIVALLDGRAEIVEEVRNAPVELRTYLSETFRRLEKDERFVESLSGHLPPDPASQARLPVVVERIRLLGMSV